MSLVGINSPLSQLDTPVSHRAIVVAGKAVYRVTESSNLWKSRDIWKHVHPAMLAVLFVPFFSDYLGKYLPPQNAAPT